MRPDAFRPTPLSMEQLEQYYRRASWSSASVDLVRSRDNFMGPTPGLKQTDPSKVPKPERVFNMYWSEETLERIVLETNRYARGGLRQRAGEQPRTRGGETWKDVDVADIRAWLGICILMGCKRLPCVRNY